ncbi:hypothetical protein [Legionella tunisiensis]|uniref:hypothetical protein n=1 Tax=Legionella tunisiensis TaxID=1034944 RepID=UPI00036E2ACD|nr:hypothetical protein [Legionella tunisiensis]
MLKRRPAVQALTFRRPVKSKQKTPSLGLERISSNISIKPEKETPVTKITTEISSTLFTPLLSTREKQLGDTVIQMFLFIEDRGEHTSFEGHDMVQRFLCGLYQCSYPSQKDPKYTLGTVNGEIDSTNGGSLIHDLANKLIYDHPEGMHAGIENFGNLIARGVSLVEQYPSNYTSETSYKEFPKDILSEYIGSQFLQRAAIYKKSHTTYHVRSYARHSYLR